MNAATKKATIRLLLVDDDAVDRLACKRVLAEHPDFQFTIFEAETGEQGLQIAQAEKPDCILLDYRLPDVNGVEFLSQLAEETNELPMPVVMLTGTDNAIVAVDALKRGARDYLVKDGNGQSLQWLPAVILRALREQQTIKEKVAAVESLREAEAKYRTLVEQIPAITYIASLEAPGKLLYISPQTRQLGFSPGEWLEDPQGLLTRVHPDDRDRVIEEFAKTYEHHAPLRCEYRMKTRDGRARWFLDEANVVRDDSGRSLLLQGVLVDITEDKDVEEELAYFRRRLEDLVAQRTEELEKQRALLLAANANMDKELCERKRAEAALRSSEARFRLLLESVGEGICGLDTEGRCIFVNDAALNMLGYAREELLGQDIRALILHSDAAGPLDPMAADRTHDTSSQDAPCRCAETLWRKDGGSFLAEYAAYPTQVDGRITGAVLVFREVTEIQVDHSNLLNRAQGSRKN